MGHTKALRCAHDFPAGTSFHVASGGVRMFVDDWVSGVIRFAGQLDAQAIDAFCAELHLLFWKKNPNTVCVYSSVSGAFLCDIQGDFEAPGCAIVCDPLSERIYIGGGGGGGGGESPLTFRADTFEQT
jgi:hypothetical protein